MFQKIKGVILDSDCLSNIKCEDLKFGNNVNTWRNKKIFIEGQNIIYYYLITPFRITKMMIELQNYITL